jgi:hypothetical protein
MIKKTLAFVVLSSLGLLVPSAGLGQHGPERHGADSVQRRQHANPREDPAYDTTSESTVKGIIADVRTTRNALSWVSRIHTLGLGHAGAEEQRLFLNTETATLEVRLGPTAFLTEKKVELRRGDTVEVTGSRMTLGATDVVLARQIRKGESTWTLRDAIGRPLWTSAQTKARGFWTKKRVLLAIVALKAAALATVLRH